MQKTNKKKEGGDRRRKIDAHYLHDAVVDFAAVHVIHRLLCPALTIEYNSCAERVALSTNAHIDDAAVVPHDFSEVLFSDVSEDRGAELVSGWVDGD